MTVTLNFTIGYVISINYIMMTFLKNHNIDYMIFLFVQNIRSTDDTELFTTWVSLTIICAYPAKDVGVNFLP